MPYRRTVARLAALSLGLLGAAAMAGKPLGPPATLHGNLVNGMLPSSQREELTVVAPLHGSVPVNHFIQDEVTLQPTHCHRAYENDVGVLYVCAWRAAHSVERAGKGTVQMSAARYRAALWRAHDGASASVVYLGYLGADASDAQVLETMKAKAYGVFAVSAEDWAHSVAPGTLESAKASLAPTAAEAAFAAASREAKKTTFALPVAPPDQAVVWGDLRGEQEILINRLDDKKVWQVVLNGHAQAVTTSPGKHQLLLFATSDNAQNAPERNFEVTLAAGHTYIVAYGIDDQPYLEDLGTGAHCERRRVGANASPPHERAWLACMK